MTLFALFGRLQLPLFDATVDGSGGGGSGAGDAAAAAATAATTAAGTTGAAASTAQPGAASSGFSYKEDRSDWVPKHRFNEVNTQAQEAKTLREQIKDRDLKIAALAGVTPAEPGADRKKAIDAAFREQYPHLVPLLDLPKEAIERLTQVPQQVDRVSESEKREWARHGKSQMTSLYGQVADAIGSDTLNKEQQSDLQVSFGSWFRARCQSEIDASPERISETLQRYEEGDPELLKEFVKRYTDNWVEPARRRVTQQTLTRTRPTPNSQGRAQVTSVKKPEVFKNLDERIDYAAKLGKANGSLQFTDR